MDQRVDQARQGGTNDSSVMAWCVMALKSCKVAGLKVNPACFDGALKWVDAGQDLGNPKLGDYDWEGGMMAYRGTCAAPNKGQGSMALMASAALTRLMVGGQGVDHPGVLGPCNLIRKLIKQKTHVPPNYMYFGYYATLVMFQKGGEHWKEWNEAMKAQLLATQCKGGANDGSWNNDKSANNSRVMTTALCCMCLEVYYRYLPMYR